MVKLYRKYALLLGLIVASVPSWGSQAPKSQPNPPNQAQTRQARQLPDGGSELPLLSVIGMGILTGGVISAMRTRPQTAR